MVKNGNHRPMSQPERSFWRESFLVAQGVYLNQHPTDSNGAAEAYAASHATNAVEELRKNVTWRQRP